MRHALLGAALALALPSAFAASASISEFGRFVYATDLDPNDGITASVQPWFEGEVPGVFFTRDSFATVESVGEVSFENGITANAPGSFYRIWSYDVGNQQFLLTPHSAVVFGAYLTATTSSLAGCGTTNCDYATVSRSIGMSWIIPGGEAMPENFVRGAESGGVAAGTTAGPLSDARFVTVGFANTTAHNAYFALNFFDNLTVAGPAAAPIPEPSTYALMLAGLGGVTWASRRRKRRPSPPRA